MEQASKYKNGLWIERIISRSASSPFSYILFVILLFIYIFFDMKVSWIDFSDINQFLGAFFTSSLIPFEILAIKLTMDGARKNFHHLDIFFSKSQTNYHQLLQEINNRTHMILFFVGIPLFFSKFEGFPFNNINSDNKYFLGLDIFNNFLLVISIFLLCILLSCLINIYCSFDLVTKGLFGAENKYFEGRLLPYNLTILRRKIAPLRRYFLIVLIVFITCISTFNISLITAPIDYETAAGEEISRALIQAYLSIVFMGIIILFSLLLTLIGLRDAQNIIDCAIEQKMVQIEHAIETCSSELDSLSGKNSEEEKKQFENLQKNMESRQKEWEKITQEKIGLDIKENLKEVGTFIISIIIPVVSFVIKGP